VRAGVGTALDAGPGHAALERPARPIGRSARPAPCTGARSAPANGTAAMPEVGGGGRAGAVRRDARRYARLSGRLVPTPTMLGFTTVVQQTLLSAQQSLYSTTAASGGVDYLPQNLTESHCSVFSSPFPFPLFPSFHPLYSPFPLISTLYSSIPENQWLNNSARGGGSL